MIQPIRCFTCGKVIADQIDYYKKECDKQIKDSKKKEQKFKILEETEKKIDEVLSPLCYKHIKISKRLNMNIYLIFHDEALLK